MREGGIRVRKRRSGRGRGKVDEVGSLGRAWVSLVKKAVSSSG